MRARPWSARQRVAWVHTCAVHFVHQRLSSDLTATGSKKSPTGSRPTSEGRAAPSRQRNAEIDTRRGKDPTYGTILQFPLLLLSRPKVGIEKVRAWELRAPQLSEVAGAPSHQPPGGSRAVRRLGVLSRVGLSRRHHSPPHLSDWLRIVGAKVGTGRALPRPRGRQHGPNLRRTPQGHIQFLLEVIVLIQLCVYGTA